MIQRFEVLFDGYNNAEIVEAGCGEFVYVDDIKPLIEALGELQWEPWTSPHNTAVRELRELISA